MGDKFPSGSRFPPPPEMPSFLSHPWNIPRPLTRSFDHSSRGFDSRSPTPETSAPAREEDVAPSPLLSDRRKRCRTLDSDEDACESPATEEPHDDPAELETKKRRMLSEDGSSADRADVRIRTIGADDRGGTSHALTRPGGGVTSHSHGLSREPAEVGERPASPRTSKSPQKSGRPLRMSAGTKAASLPKPYAFLSSAIRRGQVRVSGIPDVARSWDCARSRSVRPGSSGILPPPLPPSSPPPLASLPSDTLVLSAQPRPNVSTPPPPSLPPEPSRGPAQPDRLAPAPPSPTAPAPAPGHHPESDEVSSFCAAIGLAEDVAAKLRGLGITSDARIRALGRASASARAELQCALEEAGLDWTARLLVVDGIALYAGSVAGGAPAQGPGT
ncbi:uncharacterized protein BXZ73DRAFT_103968 [Epithele typhae]|uniref:uncharacterized protein n=1 Tax=Epithele typhae TaxID=378194 RepID=UPI00200785B0|nr:uncharacterized protein BXZ73DRAFT_103968 [Epithele typhae]KAH9923172.1 hypothetical protein BXZ73DRAFT_103968 [Epithele typhae]